jgi:hypothetical protein
MGLALFPKLSFSWRWEEVRLLSWPVDGSTQFFSCHSIPKIEYFASLKMIASAFSLPALWSSFYVNGSNVTQQLINSPLWVSSLHPIFNSHSATTRNLKYLIRSRAAFTITS